MGWLFATALVIGLGLGPVIAYFATVDQSALTQAFAGTAATVAGAGALGFFTLQGPRAMDAAALARHLRRVRGDDRLVARRRQRLAVGERRSSTCSRPR